MASVKDNVVKAIANYVAPTKEYHVTAIGKDSVLSLYITAKGWSDALDLFFDKVSNEGTMQVAIRLVSPLNTSDQHELKLEDAT